MRNWMFEFLPDEITTEDLGRAEVKVDRKGWTTSPDQIRVEAATGLLLEKNNKWWAIWHEVGFDIRGIKFETRDEALLELGALSAFSLKEYKEKR